MPERLQIFDLPDWLEPGEDAAVEVDARRAYTRFLEAGRRWYDEHELPPLSEAIATPDEPFDPAAAEQGASRCGGRAGDQLNTSPLA